MRARHLQLLAGITLAGALLRFVTLDVQSYWLDEVATVNVLRHGFGDIFSAISNGESTPPVYYVVAWFWSKLFGTGEVGLRSLSALLGTATIPVAYLLGREVANRTTGLVAAALCAFNPLLIWYSQEARSYSLMVLLTALSLLALLRVLDDATPRRLAGWAVVSILAIATHYFAGFLIGAEALWLLYTLRARALIAVGAVVVAAAALLPLALHQRSTGAARFISESSVARRLVQIPKQFLVGYQGPLETVLTIVALLLVAYGVFLMLRAPARAWLLAGLAVAAVLAPLVLAVIGPDYLLARNVIASLVPFAAAIGAGFATTRAGIAAAAGLCAIGLVQVIAVDTQEQ